MFYVFFSIEFNVFLFKCATSTYPNKKHTFGRPHTHTPTLVILSAMYASMPKKGQDITSLAFSRCRCRYLCYCPR